MDTTRIRPIAICLFRNANRILVSEGFDTIKQDYYYRPLGGGIMAKAVEKLSSARYKKN